MSFCIFGPGNFMKRIYYSVELLMFCSISIRFGVIATTPFLIDVCLHTTVVGLLFLSS